MKIMKSNTLLIVSSVCMMMLASLAQGQVQQTELRIGDTIPLVEINERDSYVFYKFNVPDIYNGLEDIIIKAIPLDYNSDPDIYISKSVQYPKTSLDSDWECSSYGRDACEIPHQNISEQDTFNIGIRCMTPCKFQIVTMLSDEFVLEDGVEFQTYMRKQETKIFKYHVYPLAGENQTITIKASSYSGSAHDFKMRVYRSGEEASTIHSKKGQAAWKKGQVVRITPTEEYIWCTDCYLTVMLDVQDEGYYHIVAQVNGIAPLVYNGVQIDDMVGYEQRQCYQYYVKDEETDLQITLTTYSGHVNVTAHPSIMPDKEQDFMFHSDPEGTDTIIDIPKWLRSHKAQQPKGLYCICIYGRFTSTYTLKVHEFERDNQKTFLEDGYSERFFVWNGATKVHLYHVPKLDYEDEDIKIVATLKIRKGPRPILAGQLCTTNETEECRGNVTSDLITIKNSQFTKAKDDGHMLQLIIDHDEQKCKDQLGGNCYYAIAIVNPFNQSLLYEITVSHSQNNHIMIQEGTPYIDSVELGKFKYYKFSTVDANVLNITFEIQSLHGDSDLYISRTSIFPNKTSFEKRAMRMGSSTDHIEFVQGLDGEVIQTYYIGVFGFTYASYALLATTTRNGSSISSEQQTKSVINSIYEGVPFQKTLHNELDIFIGFFEVDIPEDESEDILINIQNVQSKSHAYVKFGEPAGPLKYDYEAVDGQIRIRRGDSNFHKKGTYYVTVIPKFGFWELFTDDYYTFILTWRLENTIAYVTQNSILNFHVQAQQYGYLMHYVTQVDANIKVAYINGGLAHLFVSIDPKNKQPTEDQNDFSTKMVVGSNYTNAKSLYIPAGILQMKNPSCVDLGYAEDEACIIYIGVYCSQGSDCEGSFTLEYESDVPTLITIGQAKHSTVQSDQYTYFYLTVSQNQIADIYAVLTPLVGDLDLFVNFQRDYKDFNQWDLPTAQNFALQSKQKLKTEMVHIAENDLKQCFLKNQTQNDDCIIVFGIYANPSDNLTQSQMFNFVAYKNIIQIRDNNPTTAFVQDQKMTYFLYQETCANCTLIISLSSYSSGDPDLYIVHGDRIPTLNDYDIRKATIHSEVVTLNLESEYFVNKGLKSMEGYYTIGVFGNKNTTFTLSVSSQENPITTLLEGLQIMHYQKPYSISFFQYYNWLDKDLELQALVQRGSIDILVNTYDQSDSTENFINLLPQSKKDVKGWWVQNVDSQNSYEGKELVIMRDDRKFCKDCYYLIGIVTHEEGTRFNIQAKAIDAEKTYTHLLKIGDLRTIKFNATNQQKIYQFMLENKENTSIVPTIITGQVRITLSFGENKENMIEERTDSKAMMIKGQNLKTEVNYYLIIESISEKAELTIGIQQKTSIINMQDGVPQILNYADDQDISKYLLFDLPTGSSTVLVNVKSKTKGFFPLLVYTVYKGEQAHNITYPPSELIQYQTIHEWDFDMYIMKATLKFENLPEDAGLAMNLLHRINRTNQIEESATAILTISSTQIVKLVPGEEFFSEFKEETSKFSVFKIDPPADKHAIIQFSQCVGLPDYTIITDLNDFQSKIKVEKTFAQGKFSQILPQSRSPFYVVVEPLERNMLHTVTNSEYIIKVSYMQVSEIATQPRYIAHNDGHIEIEFLKGKRGDFKLKWGSLYQFQNGLLKVIDDVKYQIVMSTETEARLDSVCAIKRASSLFTILKEVNEQEVILHHARPGHETFFNVIAIQEDKQIAFPYQPMTVSVPAKISYGGRWAIYLGLVLVVIFIYLACFFYYKSKKLQRQLQFEITEVQNSEGETEKYRRVSGQKDPNYGQFKDEIDLAED